MPEFRQNTPRARVLREEAVRAEAARRLAIVAGTYTPEERETWPIQIAEAEAYLADPTASVPMLTALAVPRGLDVSQMAMRVLTLRDEMKVAVGAILAAQAALLAMDPVPPDYAADHWWPL